MPEMHLPFCLARAQVCMDDNFHRLGLGEPCPIFRLTANDPLPLGPWAGYRAFLMTFCQSSVSPSVSDTATRYTVPNNKAGGRMKAAICAGVLLFGTQAAFGAAPARPPITSVSHLAVYAGDSAKTERFYVHDLGAVKRADPENPQGVRYYFSPVQFVEVLPLPAGAGSNRMDH